MQPSPPTPEPSAEFNERCVQVVTRWQSGDLTMEQALEQIGVLDQEATDSGHPANHGRAQQLLGYLHHYRGNHTLSVQHWERALKLFQQVDNQRRVAMMNINLGERYRYKGVFTRARDYYQAAYRIAQERQIWDLQAFALGNEAHMLLVLKKHDEAKRAFEEALRIAQQHPTEDGMATHEGLLCEINYGLSAIYLAEANYEQAWQQARTALEIATKTAQQIHLGYANRAIGEALTMLERAPSDGFSSDPDVYFLAAVAAFQEASAEVEVGRTLLAQGISLAQRGKRMVGARKLQHAMQLFTRLGMVDDAARTAEAQMRLLGTASLKNNE